MMFLHSKHRGKLAVITRLLAVSCAEHVRSVETPGVGTLCVLFTLCIRLPALKH